MKAPACRSREILQANSFHNLATATLKLRPWTLLVLLALSLSAFAHGAGRPWVQVDTDTLTLTVFSSGHRVLARFHNIAIGRGGAANEHRRGDGTTPRGVFHIAWIDRHSRFGVFYGLDYPTPSIAWRAYLRNEISAAQFDAILRAAREHRVPPQNTPLGGQLGLHGIGSGNPLVQRDLNWTDGCIALTNAQLRRLARWLRLGVKVVIR